jgi:hypothetical protein
MERCPPPPPRRIYVREENFDALMAFTQEMMPPGLIVMVPKLTNEDTKKMAEYVLSLK